VCEFKEQLERETGWELEQNHGNVHNFLQLLEVRVYAPAHLISKKNMQLSIEASYQRPLPVESSRVT